MIASVGFVERVYGLNKEKTDFKYLLKKWGGEGSCGRTRMRTSIFLGIIKMIRF